MPNQAERRREALHRIEVLEATVEWRVEQVKKLRAALERLGGYEPSGYPAEDWGKIRTMAAIARDALEGK